jgi:hypothetical protein
MTEQESTMDLSYWKTRGFILLGLALAYGVSPLLILAGAVADLILSNPQWSENYPESTPRGLMQFLFEWLQVRWASSSTKIKKSE